MDTSRIETNDRIFIGFSSSIRYEIVESILHHLGDYGMATWYDRHKMRLGDVFADNFNDGILKSKYAVIILSPNFQHSQCFAQELEYIKNRFDSREMRIFPILYNTGIDDIPSEYQWIRQLIYKKLDNNTGSLLVCNHIMTRILTDELTRYTYKTLYEILQISLQCKDVFVSKILQAYLNINNENKDARIAVLYCLYQYITTTYGIVEIVPQFYWKCFERLMACTKLHLDTDMREILILELSTMIIVNKMFTEHLL